jgi:hypothetical protein
MRIFPSLEENYLRGYHSAESPPLRERMRRNRRQEQSSPILDLLYELGYVIPRVGSLTGEKSCVGVI